jgi:hypothetical protein
LKSFIAATLLFKSHTTAGRLSVGIIPNCCRQIEKGAEGEGEEGGGVTQGCQLRGGWWLAEVEIALCTQVSDASPCPSSITLKSFMAATLLVKSQTTAGRLSVGIIPSCMAMERGGG